MSMSLSTLLHGRYNKLKLCFSKIAKRDCLMFLTKKITLYGDRFVNYSDLYIPHSKHIKISLCFINIYDYLSTKIKILIKT